MKRDVGPPKGDQPVQSPALDRSALRELARRIGFLDEPEPAARDPRRRARPLPTP